MEYSIVNYSEIDKVSFRLDAEFFQPEYLKLQTQIEKINSQKLIDFQVKIKHPTEIKRKYVDEGVLFLRAQNVRPLLIDLTVNPVYISEEDAELLRDNTIDYKDILLTRSGANFGQCAIYLENRKAIASSHTFIIKSGELNPFFLTVFFNTRHGRKLLDRGMYGGAQPEIAPSYLYRIPIPNWGNLERRIEKIYLESQKFIQLSKTTYHRAQTLLLSSLGLADWLPEDRLWFVKDYAEVKAAERFDADYFQPKYDEIIAAVKACPGGWNALGNLVSARKCIEVGSAKYLDEGVPFVRVSDLGPFEIAREKRISESLYSSIKEHQPEQGEILFSKDATPGIAHYLNEKPERMIPSGGILRLKSKTDKVNNEYLTLALNSILTQEQVNRDVGGSVILHWRPEQVKRTAIPLLPEELQAEIRRMVVESSGLRAESGRLLECAGRAVEIAIEEDERTAVAWLERETEAIR